MEHLCRQCPRQCRTDRTQKAGFCGAPDEIRLARVSLHQWEEPSVSGATGSGTLFFCGCNLRCVFCQNREISHGELTGKPVSPSQLKQQMLRLRDAGAVNINLVTPTHYAEQLIPILREIRPQLSIPIVYNCGGYESVETLQKLAGLIDVYLPDFKYFSTELSASYSSAPDYYPVAREALREMLRQTGAVLFPENGILQRGVIVRHLVLPGCRQDSIVLLRELHREFGNSAFLLSLMSQYTPEFAAPDADRNLHRRLTTFEYQSVLREAEQLGFSGYFQHSASSDASFTPNFREETF